MMNKQDILLRAKGLLRARRISYDKQIMHPVRDWLAALLCFFTLLIVGGAYSAHQFVTYRNIDIYEKSLNETTVKYNELLIDRMLEEYAQREERYRALQEAVPQVPVIETESATGTDPIEQDNQTDPAEEGSEDTGEALLLES